MAKVVVVSSELSPTVEKLLNGLQQQMHSVVFITTKGVETNQLDNISILQPFKNWSVYETIKILPIFYSLNPQIVHFVLNDSHLSLAQGFLALITKTLPHTVLTTSLLHVHTPLNRQNLTRYLLQESDIVTCPSVEILGKLRGLNIRMPKQGRGVLPPLLTLSHGTGAINTSEPPPVLTQLKNKKFFLMPFLETEFDMNNSFFRKLFLLASHHHVVLVGTMDKWKLREKKKFQSWMQEMGLDNNWSLTGSLSPNQLQQLLTKSLGFILAGENLTPFELSEYFVYALKSKCTLILDDRQSLVHADLWKNGVNCWIVSSSEILKKIQSLLEDNKISLSYEPPDDFNFNRNVIDAPLNELNRLYNKALASKHM